MTPPLLEVLDLHKRYGSLVALHRVSFGVPEGEMFGLLGPNGAGKTTLLSIVSCLLTPTSGEVRLLGRPLRPSDRETRRILGIVPQELALYVELSARENLLFFGELYGLRGPELRRRVDDVLAATGLADRADGRVDTFSGGMKRRLNLGIALMHRPRLLLLDEPTVGVDPQSRNHIFEEVRRLNRDGVTVVYTSHYMEEVQSLCQRVGIIDHGRLVACDTLPNLLRRVRSVIRCRVGVISSALRERVKDLPDVRLTEPDETLLELECGDVKVVLPRLMAALTEAQTELHSLETEEPNLERVFFDLTKTALRD
ncbi:MAG TPA: ABC transporter ATP-binding protein [Gemmataceae bacterium]|nr:ABC transporter ATP-binding protein [Gemmataceae bacterium]